MPTPNASRLDCPSCGYNVGPTSDWRPGHWSSCPECGERYDAARLNRLAQQVKPKSVTALQVFVHLVWTTSVLVAIVLFAMFFLSYNLPPLATALLLTMLALNLRLASRMGSRRTPPQSAWHILRTLAIALLFVLAQAGLIILAVFGGCAIMLSGI